jgi:hypothetical protein
MSDSETRIHLRTPRFAAVRTRTARNAYFATRYLLANNAVTFPLLRVVPAAYEEAIVTRDMDACIEGLPRSANTFGTMAFIERNPDAKVAHHTHVPQQLRRAARIGVPCVVLIREPLGSLTSLIIAGRDGLSHGLALRVYLHYHRLVSKLRDRLAICTFEEVRGDPAVIARRLNARFGTDFDARPTDERERQAVVDELARREQQADIPATHARVPDDRKERLKPKVREELRRHPLLPAAEAIYRELAASAGDAK